MNKNNLIIIILNALNNDQVIGSDDTDKKITTLGTDYFIVRKNWLLPICTFRRIRKTPQIDKQTKQPIDAFDYKPFSFRFVYFPRLWPYFDSFDRMDLPYKDFRIYGSGGSSSAGQTLPHEASGSADEAIPTGNDAAATSSRIENAETFTDDFQFSFSWQNPFIVLLYLWGHSMIL